MMTAITMTNNPQQMKVSDLRHELSSVYDFTSSKNMKKQELISKLLEFRASQTIPLMENMSSQTTIAMKESLNNSSPSDNVVYPVTAHFHSTAVADQSTTADTNQKQFQNIKGNRTDLTPRTETTIEGEEEGGYAEKSPMVEYDGQKQDVNLTSSQNPLTSFECLEQRAHRFNLPLNSLTNNELLERRGERFGSSLITPLLHHDEAMSNKLKGKRLEKPANNPSNLDSSDLQVFTHGAKRSRLLRFSLDKINSEDTGCTAGTYDIMTLEEITLENERKRKRLERFSSPKLLNSTQ